MSQGLDQVVSVLEKVCDTMSSTVSKVEKYREGVKGDVKVGANAVDKASQAMNTSAEAMLTAMSTLQAMSERHSRDVDKLATKIDKHTEVVTKLLTHLASLVAEQKGMCEGIQQISLKLDRYEDRARSTEIRLTVIETSKDTGKESKDSNVKVIGLAFAGFAVLVSALIFMKTP